PIRLGDKKGPAADDKARELSDQQARLALDTRETGNLLRPFAPDAADQVDTARTPMKSAEDALRKNAPDQAVEPQGRALDGLKEARAKVAELIAKAQDMKNDPLAALKDAADTVEKLLQEQVATRDQTKEAGDARQADKLPEIAPKQKDLAGRTDAVKDAPLPLKKDAADALNNAARAMDKAADKLQNQKA